MAAGFSTRMGRLFDVVSGRSVIVPIDHGVALGATSGLEDVRAVLRGLVEAQIDGTLLTVGVARQTADLFASRHAPSRILTADLPLHSTTPGQVDNIYAYDMIANVDDALRLGVDAMKTMIVWGVESSLQMQMIARISELRRSCNQWDMPLMIEPVLWGVAPALQNDPASIAHACRICVELGADIVKAPYVADSDALRQIVDETPVPIVILGGKRIERVTDVIVMAENAINAGVRGVIFGRNVWQHSQPSLIVAALRKVVHENYTAQQALAATGLI